MRTIIAGSRGISDYQRIVKAVKEAGWIPTVVLSGTAYGVDRLGELWAKKNDVLVELYPANWDKYGKSAGYKRNKQMADNAEALIAIWDGNSKGTKHMINLANQAGLVVYVCQVD